MKTKISIISFLLLVFVLPSCGKKKTTSSTTNPARYSYTCNSPSFGFCIHESALAGYENFMREDCTSSAETNVFNVNGHTCATENRVGYCDTVDAVQNNATIIFYSSHYTAESAQAFCNDGIDNGTWRGI